MIDDVIALRQALADAGFSPIPCQGKRPPMEGWEKKLITNPAEIVMWARLFPNADNAGILTRTTPTIDSDILNPEAAEAIEALIRERLEERGYILVRTGRAPKRAIPLRTDAPFKKIVGNVIAPDGSKQKVELLGDGQQVVVFGIHPETGRPYGWHGGEPGTVRWEELPYITEAEARALIKDIVELLVAEFGYTRPSRRAKDGARPHNGASTETVAGTGWGQLIGNIHDGIELHDSTCALAAKLVRSGMVDAAAVNLIRAEMETSAVPQDDRWMCRGRCGRRGRNLAMPNLARPGYRKLQTAACGKPSPHKNRHHGSS